MSHAVCGDCMIGSLRPKQGVIMITYHSAVIGVTQGEQTMLCVYDIPVGVSLTDPQQPSVDIAAACVIGHDSRKGT